MKFCFRCGRSGCNCEYPREYNPLTGYRFIADGIMQPDGLEIVEFDDIKNVILLSLTVNRREQLNGCIPVDVVSKNKHNLIITPLVEFSQIHVYTSKPVRKIYLKYR